MTSNNVQTHLQNTTPSFHPNPNQSPELPQSALQGAEISNATYSQFDPTNMQYAQQELSTSNQEIDILADILPPSGPSPPGDHAISSVQPATQTGFESYGGPTSQQTGYMAPPGQAGALTVLQFNLANSLHKPIFQFKVRLHLQWAFLVKQTILHPMEATQLNLVKRHRLVLDPQVVNPHLVSNLQQVTFHSLVIRFLPAPLCRAMPMLVVTTQD